MVNLLVVSASSLAAVIVVFAVTFVVGRRIGRYNVVDVTWGLAFVVVAAVAAVLGTGDLFRRVLLLVLVSVWGLRLAWHLNRKLAGHGEDPRYENLLRGDFSPGNVLRKIFLLQGLRDLNVPEEAIPGMAQGVMKVTRLLANNPRRITLEDAERIYRSAW